MIQWSPIFHFYQPTTSTEKTVNTVLETCYMPVLKAFLNNPRAQATFHINGSLTLYLEHAGHTRFFDSVKELIQRGQVELMAGPAFHPIVPLSPWNIVEEQIEQTTKINEYFYQVPPSELLFLPELAADTETIHQTGNRFSYVLIDQSSVDPEFDTHPIPPIRCVQLGDTKLVVNARLITDIFRAYPRVIQPDRLIQYLHSIDQAQLPIVNANDVEVFGHHYEERIHLLEDILSHPDVTCIKLSDAVKDLPTEEITEITASSWQTTKHELIDNKPFPKWNDTANKLQQQYAHLAELAYNGLQKVARPDDDVGLVYNSALQHFNQGIASCHTYWLSNMPWWHPEFVEEGAQHLVKTLRTLPVSKEDKREGEHAYTELLKDIWDYHWSGKVEEHYKSFDAQRYLLLQDFPNLGE